MEKNQQKTSVQNLSKVKSKINKKTGYVMKDEQNFEKIWGVNTPPTVKKNIIRK